MCFDLSSELLQSLVSDILWCLLSVFDVVLQQSLKQTSSSEDVSGGKSGSPRKSPNPAPLARPNAREVMEKLVDCNAPDMSPFRVLYNLEVSCIAVCPRCGRLREASAKRESENTSLFFISFSILLAIWWRWLLFPRMQGFSGKFQ